MATITVSASLKQVQSGKYRGYFDRMVTVIIDDGDVIDHACAGKAPLHAAEVVQSAPQNIGFDTHFLGDRDGGKSIADIVMADHWHGEAAKI